jgi:hypothetical protein
VSRSASDRSTRGGLALALLLALGSASPALAGEAGATSFSHRMAQGRFLLDGGLAAQALAEFQKAAETETGRNEPEVHHLLARAAWEAGVVPVAMDAIRRARALSGPRPDPDLVELHDFLTTRFGKVLVIGGAADDARIPEPAVPLLDPELKRVFEAALTALRAPGGGSTSVYLPVGAYRVGSHLAEVTAGGTTTMDLRPTVGMTPSGVYGEGAAPRSARGGLEVSHRLVVGGAGGGYAQQGDGAGSARLLVGWEPWFDERAGLRLALGAGVLRMERIQPADSDALGFLIEGQVAGGPLFEAPGVGALGPWLAWQIGAGRPIEATLPDGYEGPAAYLVHGPDLGLRVVLPRRGAVQGAVELAATVREFLPLGPDRSVDEKPHLAVGGAAALCLLLGGAP